MLPPPGDPSFPAALKQAREARGWTYAHVGRLAQTHSVMPARYENGVNGGAPVVPTHNTWLALNRAFGFSTDSVPQMALPTASPSGDLLLRLATVEEVVREMHYRNIKPTFEHLIPS